MAVLKTQCPECDAKIRLTVDAVGAHETECPKCGTAFTAEATASSAASAKSSASGPAKKSAGVKETAKASSAAKKTKASARDDEDDAPRKKKKKKGGEDDGKKKLMLAGGVGVLLLAAVVAVVLAVSGREKSKPAETAANTTPANTQAPAPAPAPRPNVVSSPVVPPPAPGPKPPVVPPKNKEPDEADLPKLPDPPRIRLEGSLVPQPVKAVAKAPEVVPLAPEEDPFVRAKNFTPDGPLPELPKLPDRGVRPVLALDSGGHTAFVMKAFFTPDGKKVITVSKDKSVRVWDPGTSTAVRTIRFPAGPGEEGMLRAAALSRNGKRLAVGGEPLKDAKTGEAKPGKNPIFIVSPDTGSLIRRIDAGSDVINCMHFSNDGNRLAVGCLDTVLQVFDVTTGTQLGAGVPGVAGYEVKFNPMPNTNYIASLGPRGRVLIVDMKTRQTLSITVGADGGGPAGAPAGGPAGGAAGGAPLATKLAWSNDGKFLAVGCRNGSIYVYGLDGKLVSALPTVTAEANTAKGPAQVPVAITDLAFMPNDRDLAVVGYHKFAALVDANTGAVRVQFKGHPNTVFASDVSPDGTRVVSCGGYHEEVMVWSTADAKLLHKMGSAGAAVWALGWSKDGKSIAWGGKDRPDKGETELPLEYTFRLDELGLGGKPDPTKYVQTVTSDVGVGLLKAPPGLPGFLVQTPDREPQVLVLGGSRENIYSATLLPNGNAIVAGGIADIYLINPATLKVSPNPFVGHTGNVLCVTPSPDGKYFATGSSDQTIRIWRRDLEEPLLNIFVADREWIAWTPQGYYACSPQGERLMAWQINPGSPGTPSASKAPTVHPAERFRDTLYKPALLKYVVPAGSLPLAMAMAVKYDKDRLELKNIADVIPPEVTLDGFGDVEVKVEKDTFTVKATARGIKAPVKSMRLLVDGRPFQGKDGVRAFPDAKPGADAAATWDVPLTPGTHTFAVIADTGVSRGMSKLGVAVRPGTPPKPNLYVLAMGVSDYPKGVNPLHYCASDAQLLADAFQKQSKAVFANIEVKILTDKACTKQGMTDGLKWLKSKMTPQDVGVVSFSGHGSRDPFGGFYLVPADVDPNDDSNRTSFPGAVLKDALDNMPGRLVAILDACHSGMAGNDGREPPKADALVRDLAAEDSGVIVMCASLGREYAIESKATKAGFYTLGLVEGMSGHGDIDGDGVIYLHELDVYATARVRQLSMGRQNPTFSRPASVQPFPIARPDTPVAP